MGVWHNTDVITLHIGCACYNITFRLGSVIVDILKGKLDTFLLRQPWRTGIFAVHQD